MRSRLAAGFMSIRRHRSTGFVAIFICADIDRAMLAISKII
jgi:hypothetical protein